MSKLRVLISFVLISLSLQGAQAIDFKSYKPLSSQVDPKMKNLETAMTQKPSESSFDDLIRENLNKNWKKSDPHLDINIKMINPYQIKNYQEGTGTRGGGSGLIVKVSDSFDEVQLLEIFRSAHLSEYNLFFPLDSELRAVENASPTDEATQLIFEKVLNRISIVAPNLARKIKTLYLDELPFKKWIPIYAELPMVDDEVKYPLESNTQKVQIAYRRTHYIMYNIRAYAAMSPLNRAALWLHEYIYALSGSENSIKSQRAVSLFFSSEFLTIASDIPKLTQLFFELDLLSISRMSVSGSLPPGASLSSTKQIENCGLLANLKGTSVSSQVDFTMLLGGSSNSFSLDRSTAFTVLNAILWGKLFLRKSFPLYKYPGHKIMPDRICFDSSLKKITQVQSSLAIDEDLSIAIQRAALAEVEFYQAKSALIQILEAGSKNAKASDVTSVYELIERFGDKRRILYESLMEVEARSITPIEKVIQPKILGEYNISID